MDYKQILSAKRTRTTSITGRDLTEELSSDRSRIVYSPPFRRLIKKAQVFSLETNAAIRSRITHSLEVADIGRLIAYGVTKELIKKEKISSDLQLPIILAVENACLLHDIGNPPFGHFGETAIKKWFTEFWKKKYRVLDIPEASKSEELNCDNLWIQDFLQFDGNPQGLRIILRLQRDKDQYGLNLTYTTILSFIKYVRATTEERDTNSSLKKKAGYFESEKGIIKEIKKSLSIDEDVRYPLAYIMEAADDIAYCISDIEDGIEKEIISAEEFFEDLNDEWRRMSMGEKDDFPLGEIDESLKPPERFLKFKTSYTRQAIKTAIENYVSKESDLLTSKPPSLFPEDSPQAKGFDCLKTVSRKKLFRSAEAENPELAGYEIIKGLLNAFRPLLLCKTIDFEKLIQAKEEKDPTKVMKQDLDLEWRLFNKLPPKHVNAYVDQIKEFSPSHYPEWYFRAHLIVDYISGMTDSFALDMYQLLKGIKLR